MNDAITYVPGIEVVHAQDLKAATGCTVVICREGAVTGVDVRGGAPGTRETACLRPDIFFLATIITSRTAIRFPDLYALKARDLFLEIIVYKLC